MSACSRHPETTGVAARANAVGAGRRGRRQKPVVPRGMTLAAACDAMLRVAGLGLLLGVLALACGGRTEGGVPNTREPEPATGSKDPPSSGCGALHGQCDADADTELGECELGPRVFSSNEPCGWLADERCYDTREMACNCACPRDRDSQCLSGFDEGPDGHVQVDCF